MLHCRISTHTKRELRCAIIECRASNIAYHPLIMRGIIAGGFFQKAQDLKLASGTVKKYM